MTDQFTVQDPVEKTDSRMIVLMRLVLAVSALLIIFIDPSEPNRLVLQTYLALILYTGYSGTLYLLYLYGSEWADKILPVSYWLDVGWYILLIALSSGTSSIFFFFFFFAILNASFTKGFSAGLKVTLISFISFTVIGFLTSPGGQNFELNRFLLRPIYLTVLGYMIAYWGGYEIKIRRRLALLKEISVNANPRFGAERTIRIVTKLLRRFYQADECFLLMREEATGEVVFYTSDQTGVRETKTSSLAAANISEKIFSLPENRAVVYGIKKGWLGAFDKNYFAVDLNGEENVRVETDELFEKIAEKLDARSYLTVPVRHRGETIGRIFLSDRKPDAFEQTDVEFLLQAVDQFMPIVENIRLIDDLALSAAAEERKMIARDIHDSIVQPYIGLQLAVDSVLQLLDKTKDKATGDSGENETLPVVEKRIRRLRKLTETGIDDLRGYIRGLAKPRGRETNLLPALRRFSEKFTAATGISIKIKFSDDIQIPDRLASELFQIVVEGLSNVRRHTTAKRARIDISSGDNSVLLAIENDRNHNDKTDFMPRSISERVRALGGVLEIGQDQKKTIVRIEIPL